MCRKYSQTVIFLMCFAVLSLAGLLPSSHGYCSEKVYQVTESQLTMLENNLTELESNNQRLQVLLNESKADSAQARELCQKLQEQVLTLQKQLTELQAENQNAMNSLKEAESSLSQATTSFEASEREHQRTERRLKTQRTAWELIAGSLLLYLAF